MLLLDCLILLKKETRLPTAIMLKYADNISVKATRGFLKYWNFSSLFNKPNEINKVIFWPHICVEIKYFIYLSSRMYIKFMLKKQLKWIFLAFLIRFENTTFRKITKSYFLQRTFNEISNIPVIVNIHTFSQRKRIK